MNTMKEKWRKQVMVNECPFVDDMIADSIVEICNIDNNELTEDELLEIFIENS